MFKVNAWTIVLLILAFLFEGSASVNSSSQNATDSFSFSTDSCLSVIKLS